MKHAWCLNQSGGNQRCMFHCALHARTLQTFVWLHCVICVRPRDAHHYVAERPEIRDDRMAEPMVGPQEIDEQPPGSLRHRWHQNTVAMVNKRNNITLATPHLIGLARDSSHAAARVVSARATMRLHTFSSHHQSMQIHHSTASISGFDATNLSCFFAGCPSICIGCPKTTF